MSRGFHNLTAHYNVYFNGNESYKSGVKKVRQTVKNDYSEILPLFEYSSKENVLGVSAEMDRAIQKGVKLISKHSITKKPKKKGSEGSAAYQEFYNQKEFNKWVDDAYLLIGKAQFYKHEFNQSILTFDHIIRDFGNDRAAFEAKIRKAASYAEKGDYSNARETLETYEESGNAPLSLKGLYMAVYADLLLKQNNYNGAIPYLEDAVENAPDKWSRTRYQYVLAQIYEAAGFRKEAVDAYDKVLKLRPPYEMAFNAHVGRVAIILEGASTSDIKREINKLLKNKKNIEFRDRIYYALANVNMQEGDEKEAIKNLKLSTSSSVSNDKQKAKSFIKLGDIYFSQPNYRSAYESYDSAIVFIPKADPQFNLISDKYKSLKLLVDQIDIVVREDSLQRLANMSEMDRMSALTKIIEDEKKRQEDERKRLQESDEFSTDYGPQFGNTVNTGGKWYFYNPPSVSMGRSEFERRWGKRKLEDNWRRTDKSVVMNAGNEDPGEPGEGDEMSADIIKTEDQRVAKESSQMTIESLTEDIPLSDSAMVESNQKIESALLEMGIIYRDYFGDYTRAAETFNELLIRYKKGEKREDALIELYQVYYYANDKEGMASTSQRIIAEYPNSKFAAYLNDPDFFKKMEQLRLEREAIYESTYANYLNGLYPEVIRVADVQLTDSETDQVLQPKYQLLKSLSFARMGESDLFRTNLNELIQKHPGTEEADLAAEFIKELGNGRIPVKNSSPGSNLFTSSDSYAITIAGDSKKNNQALKYDPDAPHSLVVIINPEADMKRLIYNFADYNFGRFLLNDYDMIKHTLPDNSNVLEVKGFNNKREALDYFYAVRQNPSLFTVKNGQKPKLFAITDNNLKQLISSGDIVGQVTFFVQNYLLTADEQKALSNDSISVAMSYVQPIAQIISDKTTVVETSQTDNQNKEKGYSNNETPFHVVVSYDAARINNERLKTMVMGFNRNKGLTHIESVEVVDLSETRKLLVIKSFDSDNEASDYVSLIGQNPFVLRDISLKKHEIFIIGDNNFGKLLKDKSVDEYLRFSNQDQ